MRADAVETPERKEFLQMLRLQERLGKGSDELRRFFAQWCFDEVQAAHGGRLLVRLRCPADEVYTAENAYADILVFVHHFGLDVETALEGLEWLLHKWSTDFAATLPTASVTSRMKETAVRLAGSRVSS